MEKQMKNILEENEANDNPTLINTRAHDRPNHLTKEDKTKES